MQYGHFDDEKKEYVIDRPDTPRPWSNYLGSTEYGAIITNHAGGYSFLNSVAQGRFTRLRFNSVPLDQPGRNFYIRDQKTGDFWTAAWQPVGKDLNEYKSTCRHGTAYTIIDSEYSGIKTESTYFVPIDRHFECWIFKIKNVSQEKRSLSVFTYVEFANEWSAQQDLFNLQYSLFVVRSDVIDNIIDTAMLPNIPEGTEKFDNEAHGRHSFFTLVGAEPSGYDTRREIFLGPYGTYAAPDVVKSGKCRNSLSHGDNACGTFQVDIELAPEESKEFMVLMGVGTAEIGKKVKAEFNSIEKAKEELKKVKQYWHKWLGRFVINTPDKELDSMINVWNAYNCLITFAWSRAASLIYGGARDGLGYRDTVQDFLGVMPAIPEQVKERLELMITGQFSTGGAKQVIQPFAHKPGTYETPSDDSYYRSDDCLWLFNAVPEYVKETGDIEFYNKKLPYADKGEDTVIGHLRRALEFNLNRLGQHGLPCGLEADWNDCLRLGQRGETVFVTFQMRYGLTVYIEICKMLNKNDEVKWAEENLKVLDENIQKHTWDGEWFVRAYREDGSIIGTKDDPEGSLFLNTQTWAIISGAATDEQKEKAMKSVKEKLATDYGIMLCAPPFQKTVYHVVRAVLFNSGQKENASIFCHTQGWAIMAEAMLGHGELAYQYARNYMPAAYNTKAEIREIEPYVYNQNIHSKYSRLNGSARVPWLSGTASWSYYSMTQYIIGVRPDYHGLKIDPCIPCSWEKFTIKREFRGKKLNIIVENKNKIEKGVQKIIMNDEEIQGNLIPVEKMKDENNVIVVMG